MVNSYDCEDNKYHQVNVNDGVCVLCRLYSTLYGVYCVGYTVPYMVCTV